MRPRRPGDEFVERCIQSNGADILRYLERRMFDAAGDAAEAYGETLLTAWRARNRMPVEETEARMWLFGVARNVLANNRRAHARRSAAAQRLRDRLAAAPPAPTTEETIDVRRAIEALPTEMAEIVRLTYWDGFTSDEIATLLESPASTVRTKLSRARELLRTALSTCDVDELADRTGH